MRNVWTFTTSDHEAFARAGGRRKYNAVRAVRAELRRREVLRLMLALGCRHGVQAAIARRLGVSKATVCRDVREIHALGWGGPFAQCRAKGWTIEQIAAGYRVPQRVVRRALDRLDRR